MKHAGFAIAAALLLAAGNAAAQAPNDAQIASIVVTANQVDIDAGKLAESKSTNEDVKAFAQAHGHRPHRRQQAAVELVTKLKVTPQDNPTSQSLKAGGEKNVANLKGLNGAAFDKAYIDNEVAYHAAGARCDRQDADPERQERGAEGAAGQGSPGLCGAPRACEAYPGYVQRQELTLAGNTCRCV